MAKASKASRQSAGDEAKTSSERTEDGKTAGVLPGTGSQSADKQSGQGKQEKGTENNDAETLLTQDHRKVQRLFKEFEQSDDPQRKKELAGEICKELIVHSMLEEEIFYPACREKDVEDEALDEAQVEHDTVKFLIGDILSRSPETPFYDAKMKVLAHLVEHHVGEEEKAVSGIFAKARTAGVDLAALGSRIEQRKERLMADAGEIGPPSMRSLQPQSGAFNRNRRQENDMERWNERDERGGYMGSDDDDRGFSRGRYSSSEGDDDQGGRYSGSGGYANRGMENDRGWRGGQSGQYGQRGQYGQGGSRGYGSGYGQSGSSRSGRGSGYSGQGGYEDDSRFGGAGGGGSGGYGGARSGGYGGAGEFGSGGYGGGSDDFGRSGSRSGGGSGGYATGYGGGYGSGYGGGMGGTEDEFSSGSRRGYGGGSGSYGGSSEGFGRSSSGGGYGGSETGFSRGGYRGSGSRSGSGGGDEYSRGGRGRGGGFEREREDYGRYMSEDEDRGNGGGRRGGSRRGSGSYRDD